MFDRAPERWAAAYVAYKHAHTEPPLSTEVNIEQGGTPNTRLPVDGIDQVAYQDRIPDEPERVLRPIVQRLIQAQSI